MAIWEYIGDVPVEGPPTEYAARYPAAAAERAAQITTGEVVIERTVRGTAASGNASQSEPVDRYFVKSYEGAVFTTREENGYHDSDFYAVVWDAEPGDFNKVYYATTRGWTYLNGAVVDATEEVVEAARAKIAEVDFASRVRREKERRSEAATEIERGDEVFVFKGRKVPVGTTGRVFWVGAGRYGERVGIEPANGERVFTATGNVFTVGAAAAIPTEEEIAEIRAYAEADAARSNPGEAYASWAAAAGYRFVA